MYKDTKNEQTNKSNKDVTNVTNVTTVKYEVQKNVTSNKTAFPSFYFDSILLSQSNRAKFEETNLLKKAETLMFRDLSKYEKLIFIYATKVFRDSYYFYTNEYKDMNLSDLKQAFANDFKIKFNPTQIRNLFNPKDKKMNTRIKEAFVNLSSKSVMFVNKNKDKALECCLFAYSEEITTETDLTKIQFSINENIISFFGFDNMLHCINNKNIDSEFLAKQSNDSINLLFTLVNTGQQAVKYSLKHSYSEFYDCLIKEETGTNKNTNQRTKDRTILKMKDILKKLRTLKAFQVRAGKTDFSIEPHQTKIVKMNRKKNESPKMQKRNAS